VSETWDIVVVGAGPAGLAAATLLAEQRAKVLLLDEQSTPGGQIYRAIEQSGERLALRKALGADYAYGATLAERFRSSGAGYRPCSVVWQVTPQREVWFSQDTCSHVAQADVVILATGAMERPVPVPGWTLPGVMTAGAMQILLKSSGIVPIDPVVLAGSGPLLYLLAQQCLALGVRPAAVLDTTARANEWRALGHLPAAVRSAEGRGYIAKGLAMRRTLRRSGVPHYRFVSGIRIEGTGTVAEIAFRSGGTDRRVAARVVGLHEGVIPAQQITRSLGCEHKWHPESRCFQPVLDDWGNTSVERILVAGDLGGIAGARAAEHGGRIAALEALRLTGRVVAAKRDAMAQADRRGWSAHVAIRRFLDVLYAPRDEILCPADDITICRCEEVSAGAVRAVVRQGCLGPNQAKAFLRAGMGPCQGRLCGPVVTELIAHARGVSPEDVGYYRIRPPLKPISVGEIASMAAADAGC
jgi:NADPH-dependent 2,4-dienoyl-CoA reductase/sulfur reductase-like enzyme